MVVLSPTIWRCRKCKKEKRVQYICPNPTCQTKITIFGDLLSRVDNDEVSEEN